LESRFGRLWTFVPPKVEETIGPFLPEVWKDYCESLDQARRASLHDVNLKSYEELLDTYDVKSDGTSLNTCAEIDQHLKALDACPEWFEGGFGYSENKADFKYWSQMADYTYSEATCISIGFEPEHYDEKRFERARENVVLKFFLRRLDQVKREFGFTRGSINRSEFLAWIKAVDLDVHPELIPALEKATKVSRHALIRGKSNQSSENEPLLDNREKVSMSKIITAMAIDGYGFEPTALKSPIPKEIQDIAASLGLDVTDDTVRRYLKLGAKHLSKDWKTE